MSSHTIPCCRATPTLAFGPQVPHELLPSIAKEFNSVLNLRATQEPGFLPDESAIIQESGLPYVNLEWENANDLTEDMAREIFQHIETLPKPLLVHCNVGYTAAFAVLVKVCKDNKLPAQQCLQMGMGLGFDFTTFPNMYEILVKELK